MADASRTVRGLFRRLKQPEYTGENRCLPCTVLNTTIAFAVAGAVALISLPGAAAVFAGCLLTIALRGYLVPGTPTLVQYFPERVHAALGTEHHLENNLETDLDVETTLKDADIITECPDVDDLCLTESYREIWRTRMAELQDEKLQRDRLSETLDVPAKDVRFEETETGWHVYIEDVRAGGWQSKGAFVADLASEELLHSRLDRWDTLAPDERTQLLVALRSFVETCPTCGGAVEPDEDVVRSCCRDDIVSVTTACTECGSVLFKGTET